MKIHLIAIGGAVMHNMALALHEKGYQISGSDDEIFEPSKSRLAAKGLLPDKWGWFPEKITEKLDAVILGMHARANNPELLKAQKLGLKVYSFPEYLFEQSKNKTRVVIGGSHGKTTITSMIMHVLKKLDMDFDYMVGAKITGFETMVKITENAPIAIFEGDEYLSSAIDKRPKFHLYKPHIALISGIAWDHINVFPTFENYVEQFKIFADLIDKNGSLVYFEKDDEILKITENVKLDIKKLPYSEIENRVENSKTSLHVGEKTYPIEVFGKHNMQNLAGAKLVCSELGISDSEFYEAISSFSGAAKRLQLVDKNSKTNIYSDFAHSPSKLKATVEAVKQQFSDRKLIACMELHTFSSLTEQFLSFYKDSMQKADEAIVYFNPHTIEHKKLKQITKEQVARAFGGDNIKIYTSSEKIKELLLSKNWDNKNLLLMSSGNFDGLDFVELSEAILK